MKKEKNRYSVYCKYPFGVLVVSLVAYFKYRSGSFCNWFSMVGSATCFTDRLYCTYPPVGFFFNWVSISLQIPILNGYSVQLVLLVHYCTVHTAQTKVSRSKVVSSFFIDDIFYVVIVFKIYEIIYLRKRQYITGDIL
jgi:hypothetical protein